MLAFREQIRNNALMNISLTSEQEALVKRLIETGRYHSESEAVSKAFELLEEEMRILEEIRRNVREGIAQADRGDVEPFDQALVSRIKAEGREVLAERRKKTGA